MDSPHRPTTPVAAPLPVAALDGGPSDRRGALLRAAAFGAAATVAFVFAFGVRLPGIPLCAMKVWTGYPCPGCGMTRSVVNLCRGDVLSSFRFHPLGPVICAFVAAGLVGAVLGLVRGRDPVWAFADRRGSLLAAGFGTALVGVWILRSFLVPEWAPDPVGASQVGAWFGR